MDANLLTNSPILETPRLKAFLPEINFLDDYAAMLADFDFIACYGVAINYEKTKERIISDISHWQEFGFGPWMWRDKISGNFVGRGGLKKFLLEGKNEIEVSYALKKEYWGSGLALEITTAAIDFAKTLKLENLFCFTLPQNNQSLRVMQKAGFKYERYFIHANLPHKLHKLTI